MQAMHLLVAAVVTFALLANATSASGVIMYSLSGGYWGLCPRIDAACILTKSSTSPAIIFRILISSPLLKYLPIL